MDSLTQLALGASVGIATMGRRTAVWKAALWGGIAGTLPDLDALVDFGDAVRNMTMHRSHSHGLFWLTLLAPALAAAACAVHREWPQFRRWWLALWLALVTHPLLDTLTVYGTQLLQPFSDHPFGVGSMFIVDPFYTVPLLLGIATAVGRRDFAGLGFHAAALAFSTGYLAWSMAAQWHVRQVAHESLAAQGRPAAQLLVTPAPLNTLLWRVVAMRPDGYEEGFYSLLDPERRIRFDAFPTDRALEAQLSGLWAVQRMAWFSRGFYALRVQGNDAVLADLRMGQEPNYVFTFRVARRTDTGWAEVPAENIGGRGDAGRGLTWLWQRARGQDVPPPR